MKTLLLILLLFTAALAQSADAVKRKAAAQLEKMINVRADQVLIQDGRKPIRSRVAIYGDKQVFEVKGRLRNSLPSPSRGVLPGAEWRTLLSDLSRLPLSYSAGRFTYSADPGDTICDWREVGMGIFGTGDETEFVKCEGEVFTDSDLNVQRITRVIHPSSKRVTKIARIEVNYAPVRLKEPRLLPVAIELTAEYRGGQRFKTIGRWENYEEFGAETTVKEFNEREIFSAIQRPQAAQEIPEEDREGNPPEVLTPLPVPVPVSARSLLPDLPSEPVKMNQRPTKPPK